ncbi:IclR family transcriptional regulator [Mesorhizobium sp.]|uniref:IclR family transcriptional regulator n=1 Tax=Mesorhizobium sp. TaxID=1871066 RepID=UPI000FE5C159|nr:IclR family transcriptional regulator [Mesorhizobium sp.]RWI88922.1 MAG: IclR family transcriptional regulator [Mesorhizobium sp.]
MTGKTPRSEPADGPAGVSAPLSRAAQIIDAVAVEPEGLPLHRISAAVSLPTSTTHRLVKSLVAIGYLSTEDTSKTYRLGRRLLRAFHAAFGAPNLQALVEPVLTRLVKEFGHVFYVNQLVADQAQLVAFAIPPMAERTLVVPGEYSPIHATAMGKAIFAFEDEPAILRRLSQPMQKFQPNTVTDPHAVRRELALVKERGYAVSRSEYEQGVTAIAVPIEIAPVGAIFAVGATGLESVMFESRTLEDFVQALREAASEIKIELTQHYQHL